MFSALEYSIYCPWVARACAMAGCAKRWLRATREWLGIGTSGPISPMPPRRERTQPTEHELTRRIMSWPSGVPITCAGRPSIVASAKRRPLLARQGGSLVGTVMLLVFPQQSAFGGGRTEKATHADDGPETLRQKRQECSVFPCCFCGLAGFRLAQAEGSRDRQSQAVVGIATVIASVVRGRAWHGDYAQAETPTTGRCRPLPVGYRRPGIDHPRLLSA